jgi:uncharacterized protein YqgV (UPF0045/DUF77 family)
MSGYIGLEDYERKLEQLKGAQRWAKILQHGDKLKQEEIKVQVEKVKTQIQGEALTQVRSQLQEAQANTSIQGIKLLMTQDSLKIHQQEQQIKGQMGQSYIGGLKLELAATLAQLEARRQQLSEGR